MEGSQWRLCTVEGGYSTVEAVDQRHGSAQRRSFKGRVQCCRDTVEEVSIRLTVGYHFKYDSVATTRLVAYFEDEGDSIVKCVQFANEHHLVDVAHEAFLSRSEFVYRHGHRCVAQTSKA